MTKKRMISAAIAISVIAGIIYLFGIQGIAAGVFIVSMLALHEYAGMVLDGPEFKNARRYFVALGLISFLISIYRNELFLHSFVMSTLLIFVFFLMMARDPKLPLEDLVHKAGLSILGILYAGVCPVYICLLAKHQLEWFVFTLVVVFSGDSIAYFIGTRFGKIKLFERISPKKSVEGAIASLFASIIAGLIMRTAFKLQIELFQVLGLCVLTSAVAQLGDLCESMIKRTFDKKDSGAFMPGHGGLLDRMDGVFFGAPVVYIFVKYIFQI